MRLMILAAATSLFVPELGAARNAAVASIAAETKGQESNKVPADQAIATYYNSMFAKDFQQALRAARQIEPGANNPAGNAIVNNMKASALLGLKREKEALSLIAEAERLAPHVPAVSSTLFLGGLIADRMDIAADALDRLIARAPDVVRELDFDHVNYFLRNEPKDQKERNENRRIALAQLGFGGELAGDYLVSGAVDILLKRGDIRGAIELIAYIDEPQLIEDMLIQTRYSSLWQKLTETVGPNLENVRKSSVAAAERAYSENASDHQKLQLLANGLRHAGRHREAIALRSKLPATRQAMAEADEELGWAVNNIALALHEVGRADEADELFAMLNEAPMGPDRGGWRVSMIINRLELLVADGKFDRALTLLDATEASAKNHGNPYAQQLVRRLKYCTMAGLGRKEEAAKLQIEMIAHAKDAWHATVDGLICADEIDKAEKLVLEALRAADSQQFEAQLLRSLQPKPLTSDDPSIWHGRWGALRQRPAIAAEFERLGRVMPEQFLPPPIN